MVGDLQIVSLMNKVKEITIDVASIIFDDNIVVLKWKADAEIDVAACKEIIEIRKEHQKVDKALLLIDQREFWTITKEAKEFSERDDVQAQNKAIALLTGNSLPSIMVANAYIKLYKPEVPVKMFKSKEKALKWLKEQR